MAVDMHKLIAAIVPDIYCKREKRGEVKKIAKEKGYLAAAEKAELVESQFMDFDKEKMLPAPFKLKGIKNPVQKNKLIYDNFSQPLEPIYFWIVDYINKEYEGSEKLIDNFVTSAGSAQFSEMGGRQTRMQEEAMKMLATAGQIIKSVLNIIYDLKEFKIRLAAYDDLKSENKAKKGAALLALKQIWLDQVDFAKRGTTSLKQLAAQFDYVTIIDAFMVADSLDGLAKLDLNGRVRKILEQRIWEFEKWIKESEQELRKRYEIEKAYLKNQVSAVRLYARWAKPYLKAAKNLEQRANETSALVTSFNTTLLELVLLGKGKYTVDLDVASGTLPKFFKTITKKKYIPIVLVEFKYRSVPERVSQGGYGYRGRAELEFTSYALTDEELKIFKKELEKDDLGDLMESVEGLTTESLEALKVDLDEFLEDKKPEKEEKKEDGDVNPFEALISMFRPKKDEKKDGKAPFFEPITSLFKPKKDEKVDDEYEKVIRNQAIIKARVECNKLYTSYKKANDMPAF